MELIRLLLLDQESGETPKELADYSETDVIYNYQLMHDAGLIEADFTKDSSGIAVLVSVYRLTWAGHDFLDSTRDSKLWKEAKDRFIKPGVSWTFSILFEWLKQEAHRKLFGAPPSS